MMDEKKEAECDSRRMIFQVEETSSAMSLRLRTSLVCLRERKEA